MKYFLISILAMLMFAVNPQASFATDSVFLSVNGGLGNSFAVQELPVNGNGATALIMEPVVESQSGLWDFEKSAFIAPRDGVYQASMTAIFRSESTANDGVILGFSINGMDSISSTFQPTNFLVFQIGDNLTPTPYSLTTVLPLKQGDEIRAAAEGVDSLGLTVSSKSLTIISVDQGGKTLSPRNVIFF